VDDPLRTLGTAVVERRHDLVGAGQVAIRAVGTITSPGADQFRVHLGDTPQVFTDQDAAFVALETALRADTTAKARAAGVEDARVTVASDIKTAEIEGTSMFIEATLTVTASGRPRIAVS